MENERLEEYISLTGDLIKANISVYRNFLEGFKETRKYNDLADVNARFINDLQSLTSYLKDRIDGKKREPVVARMDNRFKNPNWDKSPILDFIKQFYFIASDWVEDVSNVNGEKSDPKAKFALKQMLDAVSPSNIPFLNPDVMSEFVKTGGGNFVNGYINFINDIDPEGKLNLSTTDMEHFKLGYNIATTPGKVVFQNDMMQLIQYEPTTEKVFEVPILIIAPWINKYYVMDLSEKSSFVKWLVDNGHTVFIISWVNPGPEHAEKSFEHYLKDGLLTALNEMHKLTGVTNTNVVGYCLGGTLLTMALAYLNSAKGKFRQKNKVKSATLIATLTDFKDVGDFSVFVTEEYIKRIEKIMDKHGYLPGSVMFKTFNLLKSNDMIWNTILRNYMMGKEPIRMDILFWNADSTNMAKAAHSFLLRNLYKDNLLCKKNGLKMLGESLDLSSIKTPVFMFSTQKDHIAPWKSTYAATQLFSGPTKFVVGGSGHVAGVVNPIGSKKYGYWTNDALPKLADEWMKSAKKNEGSWWKEWYEWIGNFSGKMVDARKIESWIEEAPGSYVKDFMPRLFSKGKAK